MKAKLTIVPIQLEPITEEVFEEEIPVVLPREVACLITANQFEIAFYNGVDATIVQAIVKELVRDEA